VIACRTLAETHSLATTKARIIKKITLAWDHCKALMEAFSYKPIPPAPTSPTTVD
jgi:hypothetical protein